MWLGKIFSMQSAPDFVLENNYTKIKVLFGELSLETFMPTMSLKWWTFQCQVQLELDAKSWYSLHRWTTCETGTASAFATSLRKDAPHVRLCTWACVGVNSPSNNPKRGLSTAVKVFDFLRAKNLNQCLFSRSLSRYKNMHHEVLSYERSLLEIQRRNLEVIWFG